MKPTVTIAPPPIGPALVRSIIAQLFNVVDLPFNQSLRDCNFSYHQRQTLATRLQNISGKPIRVFKDDTIYSLTDRML